MSRQASLPHLRAWITVTAAGLLLAALAPPGALAVGDEGPDVRVGPGETLRLRPGEVLAGRHVLIAGDVVGAPGEDVVLRATGDVVVEGRVLAAHGGPGEDGASVRIDALGAFVLAPGARVAAGAGGHGASAFVPGGAAAGGHGGDGGSVVVTAARHQLAGVLAPGSGGRGGDAFGATARGGDGGDEGALLVGGASVPAPVFSASPVRQDRLADVPEAAAACTAVGGPGGTEVNGVAAGDGGDGCATGQQGGTGTAGVKGQDDPSWGENCTGGSQGGTGLKGDEAVASGGAGGTGVSLPAGDGGSATAAGGKGGTGGKGGQGGGGGSYGNGCDGGKGGTGGPGGDAVAVGGAHGRNLLDCKKDGKPGAAEAEAGAGGDGGEGGNAGSSGTHNGGQGQPGPGGDSGGKGLESETVPPIIPCVAPDAPVLVAKADLLVQTIHLTIVRPLSGSNPVTEYRFEVRKDDANGPVERTFTVAADGMPVQAKDDAGLEPDTLYYYTVRAHSAGGDSDPAHDNARTTALPTFGGSPTVTVTLHPTAKKPFLQIVPPIFPGGDPNGVVLYYEVFRGAPLAEPQYLTSVPANGPPSTHVDAGAQPGEPYCYVVAAIVNVGQQDPVRSPDSNASCIALPPEPGSLTRPGLIAAGSTAGVKLQIFCALFGEQPAQWEIHRYAFSSAEVDPNGAQLIAFGLPSTIATIPAAPCGGLPATYDDTTVPANEVYAYYATPLYVGDDAGPNSNTAHAMRLQTGGTGTEVGVTGRCATTRGDAIEGGVGAGDTGYTFRNDVTGLVPVVEAVAGLGGAAREPPCAGGGQVEARAVTPAAEREVCYDGTIRPHGGCA